MADDPLVETAEAIALHDKLLADQPLGVRHDLDICPICVDKATETANPPSRTPPGGAGPDVSEQQTDPHPEGGTDQMSDTTQISQETHQALLTKAVSDATSATDKALQTVTTERDSLKADLARVTEERDGLKTDNARLNGDLDKAQVDLKAASDKAEQLEADIAKEREDRAKSELASQRVEQVKNLKLFPEDVDLNEKAQSWATLDEAAWDERLDEWKTLAPAKAGSETADTASAMSGTTGELTTGGDADQASEQKTSARRAVLSLS